MIVESVHPAGRGLVHLTPNEALALLGRLSQLDAAFFHGAPPADLVIHEVTRGADGELAWPVVRTNGRGTLACEEVVVADGAGLGTVHLAPDQVRDLAHRLTALALVYLHKNAWEGMRDPVIRRPVRHGPRPVARLTGDGVPEDDGRPASPRPGNPRSLARSSGQLRRPTSAGGPSAGSAACRSRSSTSTF